MSTQQEGETAFVIPKGNIVLKDGYELEGDTLFILLVKPDGEAFRVDLYVKDTAGGLHHLLKEIHTIADKDLLEAECLLTIGDHRKNASWYTFPSNRHEPKMGQHPLY